MADPSRIRRENADHHLDRVVAWSERAEVRGRRGDLRVTQVNHSIWVKRVESDNALYMEGPDAVRTRDEIS